MKCMYVRMKTSIASNIKENLQSQKFDLCQNLGWKAQKSFCYNIFNLSEVIPCRIGHFRISFCLCVKTSLHAKPFI